MKDLEKIKSEDLGCQVQDANPGNFAIEQEVAQLVGATVPQPTEPSADDARELGAQLLVFLRRALTPIQSALRTALAAIYAHLDSRCTDYTPAAYAPYSAARRAYDPMRPFVPRTLPNLLTAITAFSARKISNGSAPNDGIPDGESILHTICAGTATKLVDDNRGWTLSRASILERIVALFPSLTDIVFGCKIITQSLTNTRSAYTLPEKLSFNGLEECVSAPLITMGEGAFTGNKEMSFPALKRMGCLVCYSGNGWWTSSISTDTLRFDALEEITSAGGGRGAFIEVPFPNLKKLDLSPVKSMGRPLYGGSCLQGLEELDLSGTSNVNLCHGIYPANISTVLLLLKIKEGFAANLNLTYWAPTLTEDNTATFLQNFKEHIALRLTDQGSGKTLTLSQAVFDTIWNQDGTPKSTDPDSVIYQINKIIKTDKHWSVNRA